MYWLRSAAFRTCKRVLPFFQKHGHIFISGIIFVVPCILLYTNKVSFSSWIGIEENQDLVDGVANIVAIAGIFVAAYQIRQNTKINTEQNRRESVRQAVDIAKLFQEEIISDISLVSRCLDVSGITKEVQGCFSGENGCPFRKFDGTEAELLLGDDWLDLYDKVYKTINSDVLAHVAINSPSVALQYDPEAKQPDKTEDKMRLEKEILDRNALGRILTLTTKIINTLEWVSMLVYNGVADDGVIYQSLHQVFLSFVQKAYLFYAYHNRDSSVEDKYYTNTIRLYNKWYGRYRRECIKTKKLEESLERKTEKLKSEHSKKKNSRIPGGEL